MGGATETNLILDASPSPADLWARYRAWKALTSDTEQIVFQDYYEDYSGRAPIDATRRLLDTLLAEALSPAEPRNIDAVA